MSTFNVHEWNHKRRLDAINEDRFRGTRLADLSASTLETFLKKKLAQFKSATNSQDRTTNYQLNAITEIIGYMADLQVDGVLDKAYVDQQIEVLAPKFQEIIDNASDNFIQGTDYERSTES